MANKKKDWCPLNGCHSNGSGQAEPRPTVKCKKDGCGKEFQITNYCADCFTCTTCGRVIKRKHPDYVKPEKKAEAVEVPVEVTE